MHAEAYEEEGMFVIFLYLLFLIRKKAWGRG